MILNCVKEIEKYLGMSVKSAKINGFPLARFGKFWRANTEDLDKYVSDIAAAQQTKKK